MEKPKRIRKILPSCYICSACKDGVGWDGGLPASEWDEILTRFIQEHERHQREEGDHS